jgi:outer membrane biosynthesis protein TonB
MHARHFAIVLLAGVAAFAAAFIAGNASSSKTAAGEARAATAAPLESVSVAGAPSVGTFSTGTVAGLRIVEHAAKPQQQQNQNTVVTPPAQPGQQTQQPNQQQVTPPPPTQIKPTPKPKPKPEGVIGGGTDG